ncbi:MAG: hypothetical protein VZR00_03330 [Lachnospiraceae bacterium]|nr:hypothetical protein [Lachnospiraceae bacterium]MEE3460910.1 hypothetical protein [Lachnospiraceae bacterium]
MKILKEVSEYYSDARHNAYEYIYNDLPESFKPIVTPVQQPAQVRLERWKTQEFEKKGFYEDGPKYFSDNNEQMRSKSELLIANMLKKYGIPYIYEKPLKLKGYGIVYPDFTLYDFVNDQEIYWEHLGMLDNSEYMDNAVAKIQDYESNGCFPGDRLILSFESGRAPLNLKLIESQIKRLQRCIPENYD